MIKEKLIEFICKNINNLRVTKTKWGKKFLEPRQTKASIKDLETLFKNSTMPFEPKEVYKFIDGFSNILKLSDSYDYFVLSKIS